MPYVIVAIDQVQGETFVTGPFLARDTACDWARADAADRRERNPGSVEVHEDDGWLTMEDEDGDIQYEWEVKTLCVP